MAENPLCLNGCQTDASLKMKLKIKREATYSSYDTSIG